MNYILWFIKLRFLLLKNSLWKDTKAIIKTLSVAAAIIIAQILLINILYRTVFRNIVTLDDQVKVMLIVFIFFVAVTWIYLISFVQSISAFVRNFYKSPDMNYLISIPIPINYVFLFKFFEHIIISTKSMLFLFFPILAAIGMWINAPSVYYVLIIPLYIVISIIPCAIGVMVVMAGTRILSIKAFNLAASFFTFVTNVIFTLLLTRVRDIPTTYIAKIVGLLERSFIFDVLMSDVIPITAGVRVFYVAVFGERPTYAALFLLITSILFTAVTFVLSKKLFFGGWEKSWFVESQVGEKRAAGLDNYKDSNINDMFEWIKTEWKMAVRNHEMLMSSFFMLIFFLYATFTFIHTGLFSNELMLGVSLLATIASLFNIIAVSLLFIPAETKKDKNLWKKRYWLLKIMPFEERKIFDIQCIMVFVPGFIISIGGILAYAAMNGMSMHMILLSTLSSFFILYGSSAMYISIELFLLTDFFENNDFLGNLITIILTLLYGIFSAGSIALFLAKDLVSEVMILSDIVAILNLPIVIILSVTTVAATYSLSRTIFIRVWKQLEI